VLRLEDFALLVGALGTFALITVAMLVTKKINWFEEKQ
jgi:inner membrane protein involved in colicin E2 resistance